MACCASPPCIAMQTRKKSYRLISSSALQARSLSAPFPQQSYIFKHRACWSHSWQGLRGLRPQAVCLAKDSLGNFLGYEVRTTLCRCSGTTNKPPREGLGERLSRWVLPTLLCLRRPLPGRERIREKNQTTRIY